MSMVLERPREREERKKRLARQSRPKKTTRILARYKYRIHKWIDTEETDTFARLYAKYKDDKGVEFYCADIPPGLTERGRYSAEKAYKLDEDNLSSYGAHKAWVDAELSKIAGKTIILVFNAF